MRLWFTAVAHPRANPTERRNQELKKLMKILTQQQTEKPWDGVIPKGLFNLRKRRNAATGFSPSALLFGFEITRSGDWDIDKAAVITTAAERQQQARQNQTRYQKRYDQSDQSSPVEFQVGDRVMVKRHFIQGMQTKWIGPLNVIEMMSDNCYKIDFVTRQSVEHIDNLRPALTINTKHQTEVATQVEQGDNGEIQVVVGRLSWNDAGFDNVALHRIRARQLQRRERQQRCQQSKSAQPTVTAQTPESPNPYPEETLEDSSDKRSTSSQD